jgi:hypothetical protein
MLLMPSFLRLIWTVSWVGIFGAVQPNIAIVQLPMHPAWAASEPYFVRVRQKLRDESSYTLLG